MQALGIVPARVLSRSDDVVRPGNLMRFEHPSGDRWLPGAPSSPSSAVITALLLLPVARRLERERKRPIAEAEAHEGGGQWLATTTTC